MLAIALSAIHCHWEIAQRVTNDKLYTVLPSSLALGSANFHVSTYDPGDPGSVCVAHMLVNDQNRTIGRGSRLPLPGVSELVVDSVAHATRLRFDNSLGGLSEGQIDIPEEISPIIRPSYM